MKWKSTIQLGRVTYNLELPRTMGELAEGLADPTFTPTYSLETMVQFDPAVTKHNDAFIKQQCQDTALTIANHRNGLYWATECQIDMREHLRAGRLITLDNLNIQRQHGVPWSGLTYNIDEGGMIDEYLIISRSPLHDSNIPANGVPKTLPSQFGLLAGWDLSEMDDIILCERRRYQPDARFVATQPQTAATTYGDLGSPAEDPLTSGTRRFVSFSLSDVESWGDTNSPIGGPTIWVYRYVDMFASQRQVQRFGTLNEPQAIAENLRFLEMHLSVVFPAVHITMSGEAKEANLGELAVAYERKLMQRPALEPEYAPDGQRPVGNDFTEKGDASAADPRSTLEDVMDGFDRADP